MPSQLLTASHAQTHVWLHTRTARMHYFRMQGHTQPLPEAQDIVVIVLPVQIKKIAFAIVENDSYHSHSQILKYAYSDHLLSVVSYFLYSRAKGGCCPYVHSDLSCSRVPERESSEFSIIIFIYSFFSSHVSLRQNTSVLLISHLSLLTTIQTL